MDAHNAQGTQSVVKIGSLIQWSRWWSVVVIGGALTERKLKRGGEEKG